MSRSSKEQAARNRGKVVAATSVLIRQKGIDGVGVRELMGSVGLTQGAFARQFGSKEALAAEACALAFNGAKAGLAEIAQGSLPGQAQRIAEYYLTPKPPEFECPMTMLPADAARSPAGGLVRTAFTDGLSALAHIVAGEQRPRDRLVLLAAMVGAAVLRRASDNEALADEMDAAVVDFSRTID